MFEVCYADSIRYDGQKCRDILRRSVRRLAANGRPVVCLMDRLRQSIDAELNTSIAWPRAITRKTTGLRHA